jgi:CHAD domain-containing protein
MFAVAGESNAELAKETGPFAVEQTERLLRRLAYQAGRAAKSPHPNEVHDLRVAVRRFTQALSAFGSCFPPKEVKRIRRRLKKFMGLAGDVRDLDIAIGMLSKSKAAPGAFLTAFRKRRRDAERILTAALKRWSDRGSYSKWRRELLSEVRGGASRDLIEVTANGTLLPMLREFLSRGKQALRPKAPASKIHRLRIAAKNVRYSCELFAPVYGTALDGWLDQIRAVQTALGAINDCETVRRMVERQGGDRRIEASLRRKARRKLEAFRQLWADSFSDASVQSLIGQIGRVAPKKPAARSRSIAPQASHNQAAHA